jgi:hypothetical protein
MVSGAYKPKPTPRKISLLAEVVDLRRPDEVGRFNGWVWRFGSRWMATVKFPGRRPTYLPAEQVKQVFREAKLKREAERELERRLERDCDPDLICRARRVGLTVSEYLEAIAG